MKLNNKKTGIACMIGVAVLASSCSDWLDRSHFILYAGDLFCGLQRPEDRNGYVEP